MQKTQIFHLRWAKIKKNQQQIRDNPKRPYVNSLLHELLLDLDNVKIESQGQEKHEINEVIQQISDIREQYLRE